MLIFIKSFKMESFKNVKAILSSWTIIKIDIWLAVDHNLLFPGLEYVQFL